MKNEQGTGKSKKSKNETNGDNEVALTNSSGKHKSSNNKTLTIHLGIKRKQHQQPQENQQSKKAAACTVNNLTDEDSTSTLFSSSSDNDIDDDEQKSIDAELTRPLKRNACSVTPSVLDEDTHKKQNNCKEEKEHETKFTAKQQSEKKLISKLSSLSSASASSVSSGDDDSTMKPPLSLANKHETKNEISKNDANKFKWPQSCESLPSIDAGFLTALAQTSSASSNNGSLSPKRRNNGGSSSASYKSSSNNARTTKFPINEECTSLTISPSGRIIIGGFSDGTLRLFDTTGKFHRPSQPTANTISAQDLTEFFDCDSSESDQEEEFQDTDKPRLLTGIGSSRSTEMVRSWDSKNQTYGAVAAQIHARGVHTKFLMDVGITQDCRFAFGGVRMGSVEMVCVDLNQVEKYHDLNSKKSRFKNNRQHLEVNVLDLVTVHRFSDAKLRGFGACTRIEDSKEGEPRYRLFCGKGIKNIHIWSFTPPNKTSPLPIWNCIYDGPTNGGSLSLLHFRHSPITGMLQGISKSEGHKLRVWDLSDCDCGEKSREKSVVVKGVKQKKYRPKYVDVAGSEDCISVLGSYAFGSGWSLGSGESMTVIYLDAKDLKSPFIRTELEIPSQSTAGGGAALPKGGKRRSSGRQQRGELREIVNVVGVLDTNHVLIELSDGNIMHYKHRATKCGGSEPHLHPLPKQFHSSSVLAATSFSPASLQRKMAMARIGAEGVPLVVLAMYDTAASRGEILLRSLENYGATGHFNAAKEKDKKSMSVASTLQDGDKNNLLNLWQWGFHGSTLNGGGGKHYGRKNSPSIARRKTKNSKSSSGNDKSKDDVIPVKNTSIASIKTPTSEANLKASDSQVATSTTVIKKAAVMKITALTSQLPPESKVARCSLKTRKVSPKNVVIEKKASSIKYCLTAPSGNISSEMKSSVDSDIMTNNKTNIPLPSHKLKSRTISSSSLIKSSNDQHLMAICRPKQVEDENKATSSSCVTPSPLLKKKKSLEACKADNMDTVVGSSITDDVKQIPRKRVHITLSTFRHKGAMDAQEMTKKSSSLSCMVTPPPLKPKSLKKPEEECLSPITRHVISSPISSTKQTIAEEGNTIGSLSKNMPSTVISLRSEADSSPERTHTSWSSTTSSTPSSSHRDSPSSSNMTSASPLSTRKILFQDTVHHSSPMSSSSNTQSSPWNEEQCASASIMMTPLMEEEQSKNITTIDYKKIRGQSILTEPNELQPQKHQENLSNFLISSQIRDLKANKAKQQQAPNKNSIRFQIKSSVVPSNIFINHEKKYDKGISAVNAVGKPTTVTATSSLQSPMEETNNSNSIKNDRFTIPVGDTTSMQTSGIQSSTSLSATNAFDQPSSSLMRKDASKKSKAPTVSVIMIKNPKVNSQFASAVVQPINSNRLLESKIPVDSNISTTSCPQHKLDSTDIIAKVASKKSPVLLNGTNEKKQTQFLPSAKTNPPLVRKTPTPISVVTKPLSSKEEKLPQHQGMTKCPMACKIMTSPSPKLKPPFSSNPLQTSSKQTIKKKTIQSSGGTGKKRQRPEDALYSCNNNKKGATSSDKKQEKSTQKNHRMKISYDDQAYSPRVKKSNSRADAAAAAALFELSQSVLSSKKKAPSAAGRFSGDKLLKLTQNESALPSLPMIQIPTPYLPTTTVGERMNMSITLSPHLLADDTDGISSSPGGVLKQTGLRIRQETSRRVLAAQHRSSHEMFQKRIVRLEQHLVLDLNHARRTISENNNSMNVLKTHWREIVLGQKELMHMMLQRQRMEATTLAAKHTSEMDGFKKSVTLQISFPFPKVLNALEDLLS